MFLHADNENSDQTVDAQADLSLRWAHMSNGTLFDISAHICIYGTERVIY